MPSEKRRNIILGASITEWGLILSFIVGGGTTYFTVVSTAGAADKRSQKNERAIKELKEHVENKLMESESRIKRDMQQEVGIVRDDIRELRQIILNGKHNAN